MEVFAAQQRNRAVQSAGAGTSRSVGHPASGQVKRRKPHRASTPSRVERQKDVRGRAMSFKRTNKKEELASLAPPTSPRGANPAGGEANALSGPGASEVATTLGRRVGDRKGFGVKGGMRAVRGLLQRFYQSHKTFVTSAYSSDFPLRRLEELITRKTTSLDEEEAEIPLEKPVVNVQTFLRDATGDEEKLRMMRMCSSMSEQAYYVDGINRETVWKRYGLDFVTSSVDYASSAILKGDLYSDPFSTFEEGDGMAVPYTYLSEVDEKLRAEVQEDFRFEDDMTIPGDMGQQLSAGAATSSVAPPTSSSAGTQPIEAVNKRIDSARKALEAVAAFIPLPQRSKLGDRAVERSTATHPDSTCPCEWFVADDPVKPVRYISLQGSDSIDHWMTNLSFDPVQFEDAELDVKIHSGVYKSANKLAKQIVAAIWEHISLHGNEARFVFTGHSLGGAIATALAMMLVRRGVMPPQMLLGVYTYGCPAFVCEHCCVLDDSSEGENNGEGEVVTKGGAEDGSKDCIGLLERIGISKSVVNHVCMHRDIVPRAFACDYTLVKSILGSLDGFKNHRCLVGEKGEGGEIKFDYGLNIPRLYQHVGEIFFLQPDADRLKFAQPEGDHPMFPSQTGLYKIVDPPPALHVAMETTNMISRELQNEWAFGNGDEGLGLSDFAESADHAIGELLNTPHPLEVLKGAAAYGHEGAVSRFHKPKNYTRAIGVLLQNRRNMKAI